MSDHEGKPTGEAQVTFCATLVDEWIRAGVGLAVVAPGSRSTPMVLAVADRPELAIHVVHDERVAGFVALGAGLEGSPAIVSCTSGTAAANLAPAVVEAGLSNVPMLVVTADRPPEMRDVGAAQTIDQTHLFGRAVRWFHDPGVPDAAAAGSWRSLARRCLRAADDGPVHLNLPFREPLVGRAGALPPRLGPAVPLATDGAPTVAGAANGVTGIDLSLFDVERGIVLAGGRSGAEAPAVVALAAATGWPVLADPTSGLRPVADVFAADALARHEGFCASHRPDVVVRIGRPPASRLVGSWFAGCPVVQVGGPGTIDPGHDVVANIEVGQIRGLAERIAGSRSPRGQRWRAGWLAASDAAEAAIEAVLSGPHLNEPLVARTIAAWRPDDVDVIVASSMPVRDLEWYGGRPARAHANRGANGIDGVVSTALGRAVGGRAVVAVVGDIAFLHDGGALTALVSRAVDLRIVVVDNDGGGIFSFLPQATALDADRFERLYGTPHGTDVVAVGRAHGIPSSTVTTVAELVAALGRSGPSIVRVPSDRAANVTVHRQIHDAVALALDGLA